MGGRIFFLFSVVLIIEGLDAAKRKTNPGDVSPILKKAVNVMGGPNKMIQVGNGAGSEEETFITRGMDAPKRGRPYMATLQVHVDWNYTRSYQTFYEAADRCNTTTFYGPTWWHFCGGALIAPDTVLTAAHCVDWLNMTEWTYQVALGWWDLSKGENNNGSQIRGIKNYTIHPEYDVSWNNGPITDIAIITLDRPVDIVPGVVETINLQKKRWNSGDCELAGWGWTECGRPAILQYTSMAVIPNKACKIIHGLVGIETLFRQEICTVNWRDYASACFGDSGGVLVCGGEAAGVTSWIAIGPDNYCEGCFPSVFARVSYSRRWIQTKMKEITKESNP